MARAMSLAALDTPAVAGVLGQAPGAHSEAMGREKGELLDAAAAGLDAALGLVRGIAPAARGSLKEELEGLKRRVGQLQQMVRGPDCLHRGSRGEVGRPGWEVGGTAA